MKKIAKWIGIVLGSLLGLILLASLVLFVIGNSRLEKTYNLTVQPVTVPSDTDSLALGKHRVETLCVGCHGADLGGTTDFFNLGPLGYIDSANLTAGEGGVGRTYTSTDDFVRAIRHGVNPEGKPIFMPATVAFNAMSDQDLGAILAYLKTVPDVDRQMRGHQFTPIAKILLAAGILGKLPVEAVDHAAPPANPTVGATAEYGEYMVTISDCQTCHGVQLSGGPHPDPSIQAISPNITPGGNLAGWSAEQFIATIRTGITPEKRPLSPELMPWKEYALNTDEELTAIFLYLQSLPSLPWQGK